MSVAEPLHTLTDHALDYARQGLEIFPVSPADKAPLTEHGMRDATTDTNQIAAWWNRYPTALIGCRIPQHLVILDIDPRHGGHDTWNELTNSYGDIEANRIHVSGRGDDGRHRWYTRPPGKLSIKPLDEWAQKAGTGHQAGKRSWSGGIDILHHDHRYTILPPSPHPKTHAPYKWLHEGKSAPMHPALAALITAAPAPPLTSVLRVADENSVADWFSANHAWGDILNPAGWVRSDGDGDSDGSKWRHPNATAKDSCSIKHGCLFVYTPNTDFDVTEDGDPRGYTRFRAWAILEHDGDLKRAARAAHELRDGPTQFDPIRASIGLQAPPEDATADEHDKYDNDLLALLIDWPAFWARDVTEASWIAEPLLALGRAHALYAPGGTGKSLLSLWLAAQIATGGRGLDGHPMEQRHVLYLDYEMTQDDLVERLEHMGFDAASTLTHLHYALLPSLPAADTPEGGKAIARLAELVEAEIVFLDTFSRAVGGDENDADTVRSFYRWTGLHLKAAGRAFCRIDHAGKDIEKGQRGSSAKNDDVDVVWQMVKAEGGFTLTAKKRRMGWVPETVAVAQHDEPTLHYTTATDLLPKGTQQAIDELDRLGISERFGGREAAKQLRDGGVTIRNDAAYAAQKVRRRRLDMPFTSAQALPNQSGSTHFGGSGSTPRVQRGANTNPQVTSGERVGEHRGAGGGSDGAPPVSLIRGAPERAPLEQDAESELF
jgi:hypothetical protein